MTPRPECSHPPFVVNVEVDADVTMREREHALEQVAQRALEYPNDPIIVASARAYVDVVECSHCSDADAEARHAAAIVEQGLRLAAQYGVPDEDGIRLVQHAIAAGREAGRVYAELSDRTLADPAPLKGSSS